MRLRTLGLAAVVSAGMFQTSSALVRPKGAEAPIVSAERGPRSHRTTAWAGGNQLAPVGLAGWTAIYDRDTNVPLRLWGAGQLASGSVGNPATAEAAARHFLAAHLAVLAPGASIADFEVIANRVSPAGDIRSVGFAQRANGIRVLGGSIGFSFKRDRLVMVSSTALPNIAVTVPATRIAASVVANKATAWLADAGHAVRPTVTSAFAPSERVIVPIVRPRRGATPDITYRVAEQIAVETTATPGRWDVWLDATDASPIARKSTIHYASGKVLFDASDRHPASTRSAKPAAFTSLTIDGVATTSTADGTVTWAGTADGSVALNLSGPFVAITNKAGARATETLPLAPNGTLTWSRAADEMVDAQITAFVHANIVKQFTKERIDPTMAWLDQPLNVVVNEAQTCNAFSTGDDIHFFRRGSQCENTARLADVVYHEFGHSLHAHAIIDGVGAFDGALSEGMSDTLASLLTRDHGMGRGFFFGDEPLRDLNPVGTEKRWPDDVVGQVHDDGEIIGGTMWDLGVALQAKLGATAGHDKAIEIFYGVLQRASDIPSAYAEALVTDDDDGDLANGTPNQCEINAAFGAHGLTDPSITLGVRAPVREGYDVSITVNPATTSACPGPSVASGEIQWKQRGGSFATVPLVQGGNTFAGAIPAQPDGTVVQYKVTLTLADGTSVSYPNNAADPAYEFYVGPVTPIWCAGFETGLDGWTTGASPSQRAEWETGEPLGLGGDPEVAHGGSSVLGIDLSEDGVYLPGTQAFAESPEIDLAGNTHVRLQYYRWLGVEDGFYDKAKIRANGIEVWKNYASVNEPESSGVNHADKEWRFQDVDLAAHAASGKLKLRFELASDEGLEMGGWTMDDVCIVAATGPAVTCGNSSVDDGETCDDGNRVDGDGCSANCVDEAGGDSGCCSVGAGPEGALALSLMTLGLLARRRRQR
ncbi:MAG: hypothetical protein M3619_24300 [Myxococcota bacterium]|nr:hypothetical protein [Myxococcota bacterium]